VIELEQEIDLVGDGVDFILFERVVIYKFDRLFRWAAAHVKRVLLHPIGHHPFLRFVCHLPWDQ